MYNSWVILDLFRYQYIIKIIKEKQICGEISDFLGIASTEIILPTSNNTKIKARSNKTDLVFKFSFSILKIDRIFRQVRENLSQHSLNKTKYNNNNQYNPKNNSPGKDISQ